MEIYRTNITVSLFGHGCLTAGELSGGNGLMSPTCPNPGVQLEIFDLVMNMLESTTNELQAAVQQDLQRSGDIR